MQSDGMPVSRLQARGIRYGPEKSAEDAYDRLLQRRLPQEAPNGLKARRLPVARRAVPTESGAGFC